MTILKFSANTNRTIQLTLPVLQRVVEYANDTVTDTFNKRKDQ